MNITELIKLEKPNNLIVDVMKSTVPKFCCMQMNKMLIFEFFQNGFSTLLKLFQTSHFLQASLVMIKFMSKMLHQ